MIKRALLKKNNSSNKKKELPEPEIADWVKPYLYTEKAVVKTPRLANFDGIRKYNKNRNW